MNSTTLFVPPTANPEALRRLKEAANATDRTLSTDPAPADAISGTYNELIAKMGKELGELKSIPLGRRPGENRKQHRARLRKGRAVVA